MKLTYKEFEEIMTEFVQLKKDENELQIAFKRFDPDFNYISFGRYEALVLKSIKIAINDKYDWIGYWVYDCECGKKSLGKIKDKNGKNVPFKTLKNLYDMIIND